MIRNSYCELSGDLKNFLRLKYNIIIQLNRYGTLIYSDRNCRKEKCFKCNIFDKFKHGANYINQINEFFAENTKTAEEVIRGIQSVLQGRSQNYTTEFPCSSADNKEWIEMEVVSFLSGILILCNNITREKSEKLQQTKRQLQLTQFAVDKSDIIIFRTSPEGEIEYANDKACRILGYRRDEIIGMDNKKLIEPEQFKPRDVFWKELREKRILKYEKNFITKCGKLLPAKMTTHYLKYKGNEYEFTYGHDIREREASKKALDYLSFHDKLTSLYNRDYMEKKIKEYNHTKYLPISVIMTDINGLKLINSSYGHRAGDKLLIKAADILESLVSQRHILARWAGDEFIIFMPKTPESEAIKLRKAINRKAKNTENDRLPLSIGLGTATMNDINQDIYKLINQADEKMYQDKLTKIKSAKNKFVKNLLSTLGTKSAETKEHAVRMTKLSLELGEKIGLKHDELNQLNLLATLHDIGKVMISEDILKKPGELNKDEWEIMKKHSEKGASIVSSTEEFASISEYILHHHEHWDGSGYPDGLKETEIPLLSRLIAIVDAYDVMTNRRTYKEPLSKEEALQEIKRCSGTQFDPYLADDFIQIMKKK